MNVFDRERVRGQRRRALANPGDHDFLRHEVAARLTERLAEVNRIFENALVSGIDWSESGSSITQCDSVPSPDDETSITVCEEDALPFESGQFDLVLSNLMLHWVNDLPGALIEANRVLKPDGLFLAALFGGDTLHELRAAWARAEADLRGGVTPRVAPFADLRDAGGLMQRAGFALPVADVDTVTVTYADPLALMRELKAMGEANAVAARSKALTSPELLARVCADYAERHGDADGRIPATFQILYLTGWTPHESQQKPLRPGSAKTRLADALGTDEVKLKR